MKLKSLRSINPPTVLARRFVRYVVGFSVGVGVGLAPFLGYIKIPGFRALLNLLPLQLRDDLISLSAFFMGVVVVALQFYSTERLTPATRRNLFALALAAILAGFFALNEFYGDYIEKVPRGSTSIRVMIGSARTETCSCPKRVSDIQCIELLALNEGEIQNCWGSQALKRVGRYIRLAYLTVTGGFGILVAILLLKPASRNKKTVKTSPESRPKIRAIKAAKPPRTKSGVAPKNKTKGPQGQQGQQGQQGHQES